jgi:putative transposase
MLKAAFMTLIGVRMITFEVWRWNNLKAGCAALSRPTGYWTLPSDDADFPTRWHDIKARFAAQISRGEKISTRGMQKGERGLWQRRFWGHIIRDEGDYERHVDYIHYNPVKHGHVSRVAEWPYSSFHRYVESGIYDLDWCANDSIRSIEMD